MQLTPRLLFAPCAILLTGVLSGCATPSAEQKASGEVFDPYEKMNRDTHAFNLAVDKSIFRPASKGYVTIVPDPLVDSFSYFADNLSMPSNAVNALLQGDLKGVWHATARFTINSTIGIVGLADPATEFGIPDADTDFGETLYVWGFQEGAYIELPFLGPSNERDAIGTLADFFTNPLSFSRANPFSNIGVYAEIVQRMGDRGRYTETIDSVLYESADSYAQSRLIFQQNRRFELAGSNTNPYSDEYADPYADLYEDPYAE